MGRSIVRRVSRASVGDRYIPVVVLTYHRVARLPRDLHHLAVSPENFREQMAFLKANLQVVRFEDDWSHLRTPAVAITFDDGYADNYLEALPILKEFGLPATFFIATGNVGTAREFWWDELERNVFAPGASAPTFSLELPRFRRTWPAETPAERTAMYRDLHRIFKRGDAALRQAGLSQLRAWSGDSGTGRATHRCMTVEELQALAANPLVTIGGHTVTHPSLGLLDRRRQQAEIEQGKATLETWTGRTVDTFSYPFGGPKDYTAETVEACRRVGIRKAALCRSGMIYSWTDPYRLPRQMVADWDLATFMHRLSDYIPFDERVVAGIEAARDRAVVA